MECVVDKPYVLVTDKKIGSMKEIIQLLESMAATGKKDMLLIAEDVE
jgi:chaperonin GroEL